MENKFKGAIGAWIDSDLYPANVISRFLPNSGYVSMRLNNVYQGLDYLGIAWYVIDTTNSQQPTISTSNPAIKTIKEDARAQNPNIKLFATLAWTDQNLTDLKTIINDSTLLANFATNIKNYLEANKMNGFDIDWEPPISSLKPDQCAKWLNALRKAFGATYYIVLSPSTTDNLDADAVNANCDIINIQNYANISGTDFAKIRINTDLLGYGAKFEVAYQNALKAYTQYKAGFENQTKKDPITGKVPICPYNTICTWRMDSGNWAFEQGQQLLLNMYITGEPATVPFDDSKILELQTIPTLIKNVTVRSGDVVDAIWVSNRSYDDTYGVNPLQHGGDGGNENTIPLPIGLREFSYVTGNWYGHNVIAQVTIAGTSYPVSINPSVSNPQTEYVDVPWDKTIIAFSGSTQKVQLAGGGYTWVLATINAIFG